MSDQAGTECLVPMDPQEEELEGRRQSYHWDIPRWGQWGLTVALVLTESSSLGVLSSRSAVTNNASHTQGTMPII